MRFTELLTESIQSVGGNFRVCCVGLANQMPRRADRLSKYAALRHQIFPQLV